MTSRGGLDAATARTPIERVELYANYGEGFHSNDFRGATITVDPLTGDLADQVQLLAHVRSGEIGGQVALSRLNATAVAFCLDFASELAFVRDAGSSEPNDALHLVGAELSAFWQPNGLADSRWIGSLHPGAVARRCMRQDRMPGAVENVVAFGPTTVSATPSPVRSSCAISDRPSGRG